MGSYFSARIFGVNNLCNNKPFEAIEATREQ